MQQAMAQAQKAQGRTSPNPIVGSVIVRKNTLLGQGYHRRAGAPHAEIEALKKAGRAAHGADLYVTLEPCHHTGRTGPCTEAIVRAGIARVFIGGLDPNPKVNGRGVRALRRAGVQVHVGLLRQECSALNQAFNFAIVAKRVFVVAKWAQSIDGMIATRQHQSQWITGDKARSYGHGLRNRLDAIVVGSGTVLADDPQLNCRLRGGRDPIRVVLDTRGRTPLDAKLLTAAVDVQKTWIYVGTDAPAARVQRLASTGARVVRAPMRQGHVDLKWVLADLYAHDILSVLVEGGATLHGAFWDAQLVNRVAIFVAPMVIGGQDAQQAVGGRGITNLPEAAQIQNAVWQPYGKDWLLEGDVRYP